MIDQTVCVLASYAELQYGPWFAPNRRARCVCRKHRNRTDTLCLPARAGGGCLSEASVRSWRLFEVVYT